MNVDGRYIGERLSLRGQICTVRYIGPVDDKAGSWLGVEWDDTTRGKHAGTHAGVEYFRCRSKTPNCASFLRPDQPWDQPRTFLQALTEKYMSSKTHDTSTEIIYISGKQAEEVGFQKFSDRQAKLQGIHVLVLSCMRIKHAAGLQIDDAARITEICADITELDLSSNLFDTLTEVVQLCRLLPSLRALTLDGNRISFHCSKQTDALPNTRQLSLARMAIDQEDISQIYQFFPNLESISLAENELEDLELVQLPKLKTCDLANNNITQISEVQGIDKSCISLQTLNLKGNKIHTIGPEPTALATVETLDLSSNAIGNWQSINELNGYYASRLKYLRISRNPLYENLQTTTGKALAAEDGYMLTIARLPRLETLNYSKITDRERLNAETYYLSQIALELSSVAEGGEDEVISRHPRYRDLCAEYGEPTIQRQAKADDVDPSSLAARLVRVLFHLGPGVLPSMKDRRWVEEIPKSFDIYSVLGLIGKKLHVMSMKLSLVLETTERDPVGKDAVYEGPEWWDSDDDVEDRGQDRDEWITREIELVPGTAALATYVDGHEATIRVGLRR